MRSLFQACYHYRRLASFPRAAEAAAPVRAYCWKQFEASGYEPWRRYISTSTSKVLPWEASSRETLLRKIDSAMKDGNVEEALQSFGNYKKMHGLPEPQTKPVTRMSCKQMPCKQMVCMYLQTWSH